MLDPNSFRWHRNFRCGLDLGRRRRELYADGCGRSVRWAAAGFRRNRALGSKSQDPNAKDDSDADGGGPHEPMANLPARKLLLGELLFGELLFGELPLRERADAVANPTYLP